LADNDFEVEVLITDEPDGNDYWEFDSEWTSLEKAMLRHCHFIKTQ
jgi:hypothetical protein